MKIMPLKTYFRMMSEESSYITLGGLISGILFLPFFYSLHFLNELWKTKII